MQLSREWRTCVLLVPDKLKEAICDMVCSKKKGSSPCVFMSWAEKGSEDTPNVQEGQGRGGSALGIV